jgi:site-specific recombinase XerD
VIIASYHYSFSRHETTPLIPVTPTSDRPPIPTALQPIVDAAAHAEVLTRLQPIADAARDYARESKAPNTRRAYAADWRDFLGWCTAHHLQPLPAAPETLSLYLADLAERRKPATLARRVVAISLAHKTAGLPSPTTVPVVRAVHIGIRRTKGTAPDGKTPTLTPDVRAMVRTCAQGTLGGLRDRALLLMGFAGGFRRSELVALDVGDVAFTENGLVVSLRRSKTDQEGVGRKVGLPFG